MKTADLLLIAATAGAAFLLLPRLTRATPAQAATVAGRVRLGRAVIGVPDIASVMVPGGGFDPNGAYNPVLLEEQYATGWGYGD